MVVVDLEFPGLDGSNLLGYLAALGLFRVLPAQAAWWKRGAVWYPCIRGAFSADRGEFVGQLCEWLKQSQWFPPIDANDDSNKLTRETFRSASKEACDWSHQNQAREWPDWVAALGCDAITADGLVTDTAFRTMSGAGHQHFLKTLRDLQPITTAEQLHECLFEEWSYKDGKPGLRFDPAEDRRWALRWSEPSTDPIKTVRGANRLAVEALPLFPTSPSGSRLETTGFRGRNSSDTWFAWPIWTLPISLDSIRGLLAHPALHRTDVKEGRELLAMGVAEVYRSRRLTLGKMRNFTPSLPLDTRKAGRQSE